MVAERKEDTRDGGRGRGRGAPVRQSRRSQGLPPEEQKDLEEVLREARKASAAKRKAAEEKKGSSAEGQPAPEPAAQDAHQVSKAGDSESQPTRPEAVEGESGQDEPAQASEGGANVEVSLEKDRVSDSPSPGQDVELLDDAFTVEDETPLTTVQEDEVLEDLNVSSRPEPKTTATVSSAPDIESKPVSQMPTQDVRPGKPAEIMALNVQWNEQAAKAYVAQQVSRWEQVRSERVNPPNVEYVWPESHPNPLAWLSAMLDVSKYLDVQTALNDTASAWIAELRLSRRDLATAQDLTAVQVPFELLSPRECVAILQTMLFEAGFQFDNLVPMWFRTMASKVAPEFVRKLVGDVVRLLAVELIEWRQMLVGAKFKIRPGLTAQDESERPPILEYHAEDAEGDLLMTDYEFGLLGRDYVLRLHQTGLRTARSTDGSSTGEPSAKRQQHHPPPVDYLASLPSELPSTGTSRNASGQDDRASSNQDADTVPSQVGTADRASYATNTSESYTSRNSSSGSSSTTFGHSAALHMPYAAPMVMSAQASGVEVGGGEMGFYITQDPVPERKVKVEVDQDDVESVSSASAKTSRTRASRTRRKRRDSDWSSSSSVSDSGSDEYRPRRHSRGHQRSSKRSSKHRSSSRRSSRSGRSSMSIRSGRSTASAMSGTAELTVSTLHKVHETLARLENKASADKLAEQEAESKRKLDEAERLIREAEQRALDAERRFQEASAPAASVQEVPVQDTPDVAALIQAACAEAARVERERVEALAIQHILQQKAEDDAKHESERAAWAEQAQAGLDVQQQTLLEKLKSSEAARVREREAARNMQKFQAEQIRNLRASSTDTQPDRPTVAPDSATQVKIPTDDPERATKNPVTGGVITDPSPDLWTKMGQMNLSEVAIAQLRATLPNFGPPAPAGSAKPEAVKREANACAAVPAARAAQAQGSRTEVPRPAVKQEQKEKPDVKKPDRKKEPSKKKRPGRDPSPDGSDPDSDDDDGDGSHRSSDDSDEEESSTKATSTVKVGSNILTVRPYVNPNSLEKFNEKASIGGRKSWWERFLRMTEQGGWTDKVKLSELKMKMSSAVRNWRGQLPKHVQSNWKKLSTEFRHKYLKTRTSESERYFTMRQKTSETPLEFLYRLNEAAVKAGIKYRSSETKRAQHVKRFMRSLKDRQLKAILVNQKFDDVDDLEYVLQQEEDLALDGEYDTPPPKPRDFRADNVHPGRFKPRRPGRAFIAQSDAESDAEQDGHVRFDDEVEDMEASTKEVASPSPAVQDVSLDVSSRTSTPKATVTDEEIRSAVFRVMEHAGWRPAKSDDRPGWQSPRRENPDRNEFCQNCHKFGHKPENCWKDILCSRCNRLGHPAFACKVPPCNYCGKFHEEQCQEYKTFQAIKELVRKGMLKDLPQSVRK